jgi:hypothetical protein
VSDQQAGEERREIEKRKPGRRRMNGDAGVSRRYRLVKMQRQSGDCDAAGRIGARLGRRSGVSRCTEIAAAAARDLRGLPAVVLLGLARGVTILGERRTARRCHECNDQRQSRKPRSQTWHDIPRRCRADAIRKFLGNRWNWRSSPTAMPETRKRLAPVAGNSAFRLSELGAT